MTLMELKEYIMKSDKLEGIFVFTGEETVVLNAYINMMKKKSSYEEINSDSVKSVYNQLKSTSLFNDKTNCLFVIRDDNNFSNWSETEWNKFDSKLIKNNLIILVYTNINKGSKFYKYFKDKIIIFEKLGADILTKYVLKELPSLSVNYAKELVQICENSYSRILLECNKLHNLAQALKYDLNRTYEYAMNCSFIYIPPEDAIFSLVDACLARNIDDVYYYLSECKKIEESELNILSNLYTKFRNLLQVQMVGYSKDIVSVTGLQFYQVKQVSNFVNRYSDEELLRALRLIHYCEMSVKNGDIDPKYVIDYMLVNLL